MKIPPAAAFLGLVSACCLACATPAQQPVHREAGAATTAAFVSTARAQATAPITSGRIGDVEVRVIRAQLARPVFIDGASKEPSAGAEPVLVVELEARNVGETRKIDRFPWCHHGYFEASIARYDELAKICDAKLHDNFGNAYRQDVVQWAIFSGPVGRPVRPGVMALYPGGAAVSEAIPFEPPVGRAEWVELELPGENVGVERQKLTLRIPVSAISR